MNRLHLSSAIVVAIGCLMLAACGGSSSNTTSSTNASAATTTTGAKAAQSPNASHSKRAGGRVSSPAFNAALAKFAECLRQNGLNIPAPNTSGKGPVISLKGIKTGTPQFRSAETKCSGALRSAFRSARPQGTTKTSSTPVPQVKAPTVKPTVKVPVGVTRVLEQFTACMRSHGITNYPEPQGATFNVTHVHLDRGSAQYRTASKQCEPILQHIPGI